MKAVNWFINSLLNLVYPLHCASCGNSLKAANDTGACENCIRQIKPNPMPYCPSCGRSMQEAGSVCPECLKMVPLFSSAHSACLYETPLKEMIHKFKYNNKRSLSGLFTKIMIDYINNNPEMIYDVDVITFVPLSRERALERTYNQSELLASAIGIARGIRMEDCLEKKVRTRNQNELSRQDRLVNVKDAFSLRRGMEGIVKGANILIIDDVMTTGATLNDCSRSLMYAGAKQVRCFTLARGN